MQLPSFTFLQMARIQIFGPQGQHLTTRYVMDPGSQSSFVSTSVIDKLQLAVVCTQEVAFRTFESSGASLTRHRVVCHAVGGMRGPFSTNILAFETDNTYSLHPIVPSDVSSSTYPSHDAGRSDRRTLRLAN